MNTMNNRDFLLLVIGLISGHFSLGQATVGAGQASCELVAETPVLKNISLSTGVDMQYAEQGDASGTPVIFLHGYTDSWYSYEKVMHLLPPSIHGFALSQRGHGLSSCPKHGYAPADFAADVAAFMDQLHIPSAIIAGHSMGSLIAQRFAIDHPERTKGLVLVGAIACFKNNPGLLEFCEVVEKLEDPVDSAFVCEFQKSTLAGELDEAELNRYVSESRRVPARVWIEAMKGMMPADYLSELKKVNVPALIVYGNKDMIIPLRDQEELATAIRNVQLVIYQNAGHGLHWEEPERFANDLLAFADRLNAHKERLP